MCFSSKSDFGPKQTNIIFIFIDFYVCYMILQYFFQYHPTLCLAHFKIYNYQGWALLLHDRQNFIISKGKIVLKYEQRSYFFPLEKWCSVSMSYCKYVFFKSPEAQFNILKEQRWTQTHIYSALKDLVIDLNIFLVSTSWTLNVSSPSAKCWQPSWLSSSEVSLPGLLTTVWETIFCDRQSF